MIRLYIIHANFARWQITRSGKVLIVRMGRIWLTFGTRRARHMMSRRVLARANRERQMQQRWQVSR
jgi:hypothetical protein